MATQRLTIAKLAGEASVATLKLFRTWANLRVTQTPDEWSSEQWPVEARRAADEFASRLRRHSHEPPTIFFVEYVDLWSFCPPQRFLGDELLQMVTERCELFCLPLPVEKKLIDFLKEIRREGQHQEDRLFAMLTIEAIDCWDGMVDQASIIFVREVLGGSVDDREIVRSQCTVPSWLETI